MWTAAWPECALSFSAAAGTRPAAFLLSTTRCCLGESGRGRSRVRYWYRALWIDDLGQRGTRAVIGGIAAVGRPDAVRAGRKAAGSTTSRPACGLSSLGERHGCALVDRVGSIGERDSSGRRVTGDARRKRDARAHG